MFGFYDNPFVISFITEMVQKAGLPLHCVGGRPKAEKRAEQ
jgi:hypothetical protein